MNPWLLSLGLSGLKSISDNQANKQQIASNVITQKYSPWTHAQADFSGIGKNSTMNNMMAGVGGALTQQGLNDQAMADRNHTTVTPTANSMAPQSTGGFGAMASKAPMAAAEPARAPASSFDVGPKAPVASLADIGMPEQPQQQIPFAPQGQNPWLAMSQRPLTAQEMAGQPLRAPAVDPTQSVRRNIWAALPDSMPIKRGY